MAVTNKNLIIKAKREAAKETVSQTQVSETPELPTVETLAIKKKNSLEEKRVKDKELVRGRLNYNEVPGGTLDFSFRKYKGDPIIKYSLIDGEIYNLPRGVANHLAISGSYPIHEYQQDSYGKSIVKVARRKRRYSFESLAFFDDKDVLSANSNLYTASNI